MLMFFIADLARDPNLQAAFSEDPERAMAQAGLSDEQKALLRTRDPKRIADAVAQEVEALPIRSVSPVVNWIGPVLHVTAVEPNSGVHGQEVKTVVYGTYFESTMACSLVQGTTVISGVVSNVVTGMNSRMEVRFNLANAVPGPYGVQARSRRAESTLPRAFEVKRARQTPV
ncbi:MULTISPECIES: hypothetical protein [unclassified Sorangium]|uniref:hypothetical protein n=1 Tax=unclassified Sorangium TaxID=2621164 RepID=UPI003F5DB94F